MKKFNLLAYITFSLFVLFSCKAKVSVKDYINRGFAKPQISKDAHFSQQKIGDGGVVYVPSEKDIEVQFSIKNKYKQELKGVVEIPEDQKRFFHKEPVIQEIGTDKLVISFNFKNEAEPNATNAFLGESVGITVQIYEKQTGRALSSSMLKANCNTAPDPIQVNNIVYKQESDEYEVLLPKNEGKHQDLKNVQFTLASEYGTETVESKIVSIKDAGEQGQLVKLKIKGSESWQLKNPSGNRKLQAVVCDIAGLKSSEVGYDKKRIFTSITLLPDVQNISSVEAEEEGVPEPQIKELQDFFQGDDWKTKAGYTITYRNTEGFIHDSEKKVFKKEVGKNIDTQDILVTLDQGNGNVASAIYTINIAGSDVAGINERKLAITDETHYPNDLPKLLFDAVTSVEYSDKNQPNITAKVMVPYTGSDTNLKVYIQAISSRCQCQDDGGVSWGEGIWQKDFDIVIDKEPSAPGAEKHIKFKITSEDGSATKNYDFIFKRGNKVKVDVYIKHKLLESTHTATLKTKWKYGEKDVIFEGENKRDDFFVAEGEYVDFELNIGSEIRIKSCESTDATHNVLALKGETRKVRLKANEDFALTVNLRLRDDSMVHVKWNKYRDATTSVGYTGGKIIYYDDDGDIQTIPDPSQHSATGIDVKAKQDVVFKLEGFDSTTYKISHWLVNGEKITASKSDGSITLEDNNTVLTVKNANVDYIVEVVTFDRTVAKIDDATFEITDITESSLGVQKLIFAKALPTVSGTTGTLNVNVPYTGKDTKVRVHVEAGLGCVGLNEDGSTTDWQNNTKKDYEITIPALRNTTTPSQIKFKIRSENGNIVEYIITFSRGYKVDVTVQLIHYNDLTDNDKLDVLNNWGHGSWKSADATFELNKTQDSKIIAMAKDATLMLSIGEMGKIKIDKITYGPHDSVIHTEVENGREKLKLENISIQTTVKIHVRSKDSVYTEWKNFKPATTDTTDEVAKKNGYKSGKRKYTKTTDGTEVEDSLNSGNLRCPCKKGTDVTFSIEWFRPDTRRIEKWVVYKGSASHDVTDTTTDGKFVLNQDKTELTVKAIDSDFEVEVFTAPLYSLTVQVGKRTGQNEIEEMDVTLIGTLKVTHADDPSKELHATGTGTLRFKRIEKDTRLKIELTLKPNSDLEFDGWEIEERNGSSSQYIDFPTTEGNENSRILTIDKSKSIRIFVKAKTFQLTVGFEGDDPSVPHGYTLIARDVTDSSNPVILTSSTSGSYIYSVKNRNKVELTLNYPSGVSKKYKIQKWQIKKDGEASFNDLPSTAYTDSNDKSEVKITVDKGAEIKVLLKPIVKIKLRTLDVDSASNPYMDISLGPVAKGTVGGTLPKEKTFLETGNYTIRVSAQAGNKVICCKKNGNKLHSLIEDGYWKDDFSISLDDAGDELEVVVARVQEFDITVRYENDGAGHTNKNHILTISKSDADTWNDEHVIFPIGGRVISHQSTNPDKRKIYVTKGTELEYELKGLPEGHEILAWKNGGELFMKDTFHTDPNDDDKRRGKKKVRAVFNPTDWAPIELKVILDDAKKYKLRVILQDYEYNGPNDTLSGSDNGVKVKVGVQAGPSAAWNDNHAILTPNNPKIEYVGTKRSKFKITAENGSTYCFAEYKTDDLNIEQYKDRAVFTERNLNKDITIYVRYSNNLLVQLLPSYPIDTGHFKEAFIEGGKLTGRVAKAMRLTISAAGMNPVSILNIGEDHEVKKTELFLSNISSTDKIKISLSSSDTSIFDGDILTEVKFEVKFSGTDFFSPVSATKNSAGAWEANIPLEKKAVLLIRIDTAK